MFEGLAKRYDLFNRLTSMGMDGLWRRETLKTVQPGMRVLDLGCGTGDLAIEAAKKVGGAGKVLGLDFSQNMLSVAQERAKRAGFNGNGPLKFILEKAENLPAGADSYDLVVSGFVLRNIYENIDAILEKVYRALKPSGEIRFLDITEPPNKLFRFAWHWYMTIVTGLYGKILFGKAYPVSYLIESAKRFVKPKEFKEKLEKIGFRDIQIKSWVLGTIVLYSAQKK